MGPQHPKFQKAAEVQFADLFLKKVPTLHTSSDKTEKDLRDSLMELHKKQPSDGSEIRTLLGLQADLGTLKETEYAQTGPKARKEKSHVNKGKEQTNLTFSDRVESTDAGFTDIKLKPVKITSEDSAGLTTVTLETSPDTNKSDSQLGTIEHFDDITNMLKKMRRKPTVLEVYSKEKVFPKEKDKLIDQALTKAKLAVSKKPDSKTVKKDDKDIFVDTFLKEVPDDKVAMNIDKNKFISKILSLPSVSSITSNEMRSLLSTEEPSTGSEISKLKYPELDNEKLEDTLKKSIEHLRKQGTKNNRAPAKIQFAEVFLKSLPELVDSSCLTDTELLNNLSDMYERKPKDGQEIKERLGIAKSAVQSDKNLNKISYCDLENLVRETINTIKQKPQHPKFQKAAEVQFADLFLKKVPTLHSSSDKTEKDLRDSLMELHKKQPSDASEIRTLLGLQADLGTLKETEYAQTGPKARKEKV